MTLSQTGDTIVEVLIAMAVLSMVLGGAYVASNRSLAVSQQNQERAEALKLVEGQMEQLKSNDPGGADCFGSCVIDTGGAKYTLNIESKPSGYRVTAVWQSVFGREDNIEMWYRPQE